MQPKPGWKTTEFWVSVLASTGAVLAAAGGLLPPQWAALALAVSGGLYAVSRGLAKTGMPPPLVVRPEGMPPVIVRGGRNDGRDDTGHVAVDALLVVFALGLLVALSLGGCAGPAAVVSLSAPVVERVVVEREAECWMARDGDTGRAVALSCYARPAGSPPRPGEPGSAPAGATDDEE